ncbi:GNAT family N-acetyltransferase [Kitasatospora sp. NPDC096147]|uniref:GNAT family N-acetyltransferase n=1 Tax=Kitasatospora sp. NPDC096147 TaxID=3364093 RepID=UPI00380363A0
MKKIGRLEQANDNAASFWLAQARVHGWGSEQRPGFVAVRCARSATDAVRVVVTRPYGGEGATGGESATGDEGAVGAVGLRAEITGLFEKWGAERIVVEDPYGGLDFSSGGQTPTRPMAVMVREPEEAAGDVQGAVARLRPGVTVEQVGGAAELSELERVVVDGFPLEDHQPWRAGVVLPPGILAEPGCRAWLARVDGAPAAACMTYDNGETVGVYWVTTLPSYRSLGLGRGVLSAALAAEPGRRFTLVATLLGEPLYRQLGFEVRGTTRWWR